MEDALKDRSFSYVENMERQFAAAQAEVEREIAVWYQRFAANNEITLADAKRLLTSGELEEFRYYGTAFELQRGLGVGWTMQAINERTIEKVLSRPWTADDLTFRDRCWTNKQDLVNSVNTQLTQMIIRGEAPDKAISAISHQFDVSRAKAGRLIMTESAAFSSAAQKDCYEELGVERFKVVASLDRDTCELCGAMDGQVFKMSEYQVGLTAPPFHPWCRCCTCPYFEDMKGLGERWSRNPDGTTEMVPADMSFEEWKREFVVQESDSNGKILLTANAENGTILITGARIVDPFSPQADAHAERYYGLVRSMKTDVARIAQNTGFPVEDIQRIKDYLFMDEHDLGEAGIRRFYPDCAIAQSWQRLIAGTPEPHDLTLLKHELMERRLMLEGMSQDEAHLITSGKYNYSGEARAYYGTLKEHQN